MNIDFSKVSKKIFGQDIWRIGIYTKSSELLLNDKIYNDYVKWVDISNYDYEADPFIFKLNDDFFIAYEVFDYLNGNGKIKCINLQGDEFNFFSEINDIKGHKSFPFVFEDDGEIYCIPETSDLNVISIYKFNETKGGFEKAKNILTGERYIDSCVKKINGVYYLFTSTSDAPFKQRLFYSNEMFGDYIEHPASPIVDDIACGRNGGGILHNKLGLFRIAQDCSDGYGSRVHVMKISNINKWSYNESLFNTIEPLPGFTGIHTISAWDSLCVFDVKVTVKRKNNLIRKVIYKILKSINMEVRYK